MDTPTQVSKGGPDELQRIGSFVVLSKLGQGGMGAVYKAQDSALDRTVAIKILPGHLAGDSDFTGRFKREAVAAAKLNHPNIVQVYTAGEDAGTYFIVMEFVEGRTLHDHIVQHRQMECKEALAITIYVAEALRYAWNKARIIHRDIKPANILLSNDGEVKLTDLGLAKSLRAASVSVTSTGTIMGSAQYISPEQARGDKDVDFHSDIYSLGCTLFHMLAGRLPYEGEEVMALLYKHVHEPPPDLLTVRPDCPPRVAALVSRMMAKDLKQRPSNYDELIAELNALYAEAQQNVVRPTTAQSRKAIVSPDGPTMASKPARSRNLVLYAGVGTAVLAAVAGLLVWSPWKQPVSHADLSAPPSVPAVVVPRGTDTTPTPPGVRSGPATTVAPANPVTTTPPSPANNAFIKGVAALPAVNSSPEDDDARWGPWEKLFDGKTFNGWSRRLNMDAPLGVENDQIYMRPSTKLSNENRNMGLAYTGDMPRDDYEVAYEAMRVEGNFDFASLTFPVGEGNCIFKVGTGKAGTGVCLNGTEKDPAALSEAPFKKGQWYRLRLRVAGGRIQAWIDEKQVIDFERAGHRFIGIKESKELMPLGILSHATHAAFRSIRLRRLKLGGAQAIISPADDKVWQNAVMKEVAAPAAAKAGSDTRVSPVSSTTTTTDANLPKEMSVDLGGGMKMEFVLIPAGSFMMGSEKGDANEKPVHKVTITKPFYIGKYEVMQPELKKVLNLQKPTLPKGGAYHTWDACESFLSKLNEKLPGRTFRLPTEAEWEYACRAGSTGDYCYGDGVDKLAEYASYIDNFDGNPTNLHTVGLRKANAWGLYDMHGNRPEWCQDVYHPTYKGAPTDGSAWMEGDPDCRVTRGGRFDDRPTDCRSASRKLSKIKAYKCFSGFRIVMEIDRHEETTVASRLAPKIESPKPAPVVVAPVSVTPTNDFVATVAALPADKQLAAVLAKLKELNPNFDGKFTHRIEAGAITELAISSVGVTDLTPLRALRWLKKLSIAPGAVNQKGALTDLTALKELPLTGLWCQNNPIRDLAPLKGMSLTMLSIGGTQVSDLEPLTGMKLTVLGCNDTAVATLRPLAGMPLTILWCQNTKVADLTPLDSAPLQELRCNAAVAEQNVSVLRGIKTLAKINDLTAAAFFTSRTMTALPVLPSNVRVLSNPQKEMSIDLGNGMKMEFVQIPAGWFMMGSEKGNDREKPVHKVTFAQPFYMGKYEVTQEQWEKVMNNNPSRFKGAKNPVEAVSWKDCQKFFEKLKEKLPNQTFRLPSEAEWEYACRAGSTDDYCYGDGDGNLPKYAWYKGNADNTTHPVGEKKPNAWGLHDMHGNVWEWCQDLRHDTYKGAPADGSAWTQGFDPWVVSRGGAFCYNASDLRSAHRGASDPGLHAGYSGFRVVVTTGTP